MNIYTKFGSPTFNGVRSIAKKSNIAETWQHCFIWFGLGMLQPCSCDCVMTNTVYSKFSACRSNDVEARPELCFYEEVATL